MVAVSDNFNRASFNSTGTWAVVTGKTLPIIASSSYVEPVTTSTEYVARWTADTFTSDQFSVADLTIGTDFSQAAVDVRSQPGADTRYSAIYDTIGTGRYLLYKIVAGVGSVLGNVGSAGSIGVTKSIRIEAEGSAIRFYANDTLIHDVTDTDITGGSPGFACYYTSGVSRVDDWEAGDLGDFESLMLPSRQARIAHQLRR